MIHPQFECSTLFGEAKPEQALFDRLQLFGRCDEATQERLLRTAIRNDLRSVGLSNARSVDSTLEANDRLVRSLNGPSPIELTADTWIGALIRFSNRLATQGLDRVSLSVAHSAFLVEHGLCPLVNYAFGDWHGPSVIAEGPCAFRRLAELSVCYLLRLVPRAGPPPAGELIGQGAYSHVFRDKSDPGVAQKIPWNVAGHAFMNGLEARFLELLTDTPLGEHVPKLFSYEPVFGVLRRSYVPGDLGSDLLTTGGLRNSDQIAALKLFYLRVTSTCQSLGVAVDIHPANMVWSVALQRWFLVDAGPVPVIGADYYPQHDFEAYFQKVWIERVERMRTTPVRSVDLSS
jgi:hypothetical protein